MNIKITGTGIAIAAAVVALIYWQSITRTDNTYRPIIYN